MKNDKDYKFNNEDRVFLFLYMPDMGSGYNTKGDYYYLVKTFSARLQKRFYNPKIYAIIYGVSE